MILVVTLKETYFFFYEGIFPVSGGSHLKKCPKMRPGCTPYGLFNGKELDTGHNSSPNSELSYCCLL
jgi:hypothetical protein